MVRQTNVKRRQPQAYICLNIVIVTVRKEKHNKGIDDK
jgi:hypothetical protein